VWRLYGAHQRHRHALVRDASLLGEGSDHQAWIEEQVPACGYCQNGQMLTAVALLQRSPRPTDAQIREAMAPVLCRCFTYYRIQAAVRRAASAQATAEGVASEAAGERA
jgi:aerobic-type carbon monoxide dehydrogenase small subunit (CoxS/CutS family)